MGNYYTAEIDQPAPVRPPDLPPEPAEPVIPDAPPPPDDKFDQVKMAQYLNSLSSYQNDVKDIQDSYRNQIDLYKAVADVYSSEMTKYQEDVARYNIARISAVKGAEGVMSSVTDQYGWAWVNKKDPVHLLSLAVQHLAGADQDHPRVFCDHPVADQEKGCQIAMRKKISAFLCLFLLTVLMYGCGSSAIPESISLTLTPMSGMIRETLTARAGEEGSSGRRAGDRRCQSHCKSRGYLRHPDRPRRVE